jgi:hypothetical protein
MQDDAINRLHDILAKQEKENDDDGLAGASVPRKPKK